MCLLFDSNRNCFPVTQIKMIKMKKSLKLIKRNPTFQIILFDLHK